MFGIGQLAQFPGRAVDWLHPKHLPRTHAGACAWHWVSPVQVVKQSVPLGLQAYPLGQSVGVVTHCPPLHAGALRMLLVVLHVTLPHAPVP